VKKLNTPTHSSSLSLSPETREEIANITLHSFGFFLSLVGLCVLVALAASSGSILRIVSASVYGVTLVLVYLASILFHTSLAISLPWNKAFETVDHCAIYLLIAGTYTPFLMVTLPGTLGWSMLALIWGLAVAGILYKVFFFYKSDLLSTLAYILMGWLALGIVMPLHAKLGWWGLGGIFFGGILYTLGAVFYLLDHKFRFAHAVWHSFVIAGSLCHYLTVLFFVIKV
jgi:hemolysin III